MKQGYVEEKNILKSVVAGHDKLHTLFVSKPIKIPNVRVIVDDTSEKTDTKRIFSQLEENKELINGIDIPNTTAHFTLLIVAFYMDCVSKNYTFPLITKMIEFGADPNKIIGKDDKSNFDPWRPYYPNPHDDWGTPMGEKTEMNLAAMVSYFFYLNLYEI